MKALLKKSQGFEGVELDEIQEPITKANEIKVKVYAAGICGTDLHIIHDEYPYTPPVAMGHEYSGTVVEVGEEVEKFQIGDRVVSLTAIVTCGSCRYCNQGLLMLCEHRKSIGSGVHGAFAEYIVVPAKSAYKIPENISLDEAVLTEPLACAVRCIMERGRVNGGDFVLISGPGTIGLLALQVVKANGGNCIVIGTSHDKERLNLALEMGAMAVIDVEEENSEERLMALTKQQGFDVAIECAGVSISLNNCIKLLRKQGMLIQMGLFGKKIEFDSDLSLIKEINYVNGFATEPTSWEIALRLLEYKHVDVLPLISNKLSIDNWQEAIHLAEQKVGYKTLLFPNT
ncbi:L-iditol 2-dehydrogenase [Peribacillus simplex]|uniref:L-iditol 2-dehydrogenase n=1 Tax=Peribacillus simplex TaxID=1478 RepID=A0A9X8RAM6_9BACI|nr:zinc-binding dehydrogenase [Peribacillus simplex]SIR60581.1 L-iditol 2-dehydrogenase [Peribacillus simplex]